MAKRDMKALVKALGVQERVLLFCLASGTDWKQAGVTLETVGPMMMVSNGAAPLVGASWGRLALTDAGRAALRELLRDL
jgi:hypothetical protein